MEKNFKIKRLNSEEDSSKLESNNKKNKKEIILNKHPSN
jgi:hypothetical protein